MFGNEKYCTNEFLKILNEVTFLVTITQDVKKLYLCPVLNFLASDLRVAQDNHWSGFYVIKVPYPDGFMFWKNQLD